MSRSSKKPAELRDSWRAPEDGALSGGSRLIVKRLVATLLLLPLTAVWYFALFGPVWHPRVHFVAGIVGEYVESPGSEVLTARPTARFLHEKSADFATGPAGNIGEPLQLRSRDDFTALADRIRSDDVRANDVLIVWLQAQGVGLDGRAVLLSADATVSNVDVGRYPLQHLLDALRQSRAGVKLLLLEAGGREHDARLGVFVNEFPRLAKQAVEATGDPNLWVALAAGPVERSHTAADLRQTVFGHFTARGLGGEADQNGDRFIDVGELHDFVRSRVASWADAATTETSPQTPQLFCGRAFEADRRGETPVLVPVAVDFAAVASALASATGTAAPPAAEPTTPAAPDAAPAPVAAPSATAATPAPAAAVAADGKPADATTAATLPDDVAPSDASAAAPTPAVPYDPAAITPRPAMKTAELVAINRLALAMLQQRSPDRPCPIDYAPLRWQELRRRVDKLIVAAGDPSVDPAKAEAALRREAAALAAFARGDDATTELPEPLASLAALRRPPPLDVARLRTWALVERYVRDGGPAPPAALSTLAVSLDTAFAAADAKALQEVVAKPWPRTAERYAEFAFAKRLAAPDLAPWATLQRAWRTCREGERVAADPAIALAAVQSRIVEADHVRHAAECRLFDAVLPDAVSQADREFDLALGGYRAAAEIAAEWHRARQLADDVLARAGDYAAWHLAADGDPTCSPSYEHLVGLLDELQGFVAWIDDATAYDPTRSADRRRKLQRFVDLVEKPLQAAAMEDLIVADGSPAAQRRRVAVLLNTPLLSLSNRARLEEFAGRLDAVAAPLTTPIASDANAQPPRRRPPVDWARAERARELQTRLAQLAEARRVAADAAPPTSSPATNDEVDASIDEDEATVRWAEFSQEGAAVAAAYAALPAQIDAVVQKTADQTNPTARPEQLSRLQAADRRMRLQDVRDAARSAEDSPHRRLRLAAWYDALAFNRDRLLARRQDAAAGAAAVVAEAAEDLAILARQIPQQPPLPPAAGAAIRLVGTSELAPGDDASRDWNVELTYVGGAPSPVWLTLEFDPERLEVVAPSGLTIYEDHVLRPELERLAAASSAEWHRLRGLSAEFDATAAAQARRTADDTRRAAQFPLRPNLAALPATLDMQTGDARRLTFRVRRKSTAAGKTTIVLRALSGDTLVRHDAKIALPPLDAFVFAPAAGSGSWSTGVGGIVLHPWPNRTTDYEFQLANIGTSDRVVDVEFLAPERRIEGALPSTLRTVQTSEVASLIGPARTIVKIDELKLPGGGKPVTLAAPKPKDDKEPPKTPDEKNRAETTVGTTPDAAATPTVPVRQGMLVVVRSRETGDTMLRRIDFRPERPRRYLRAKVGYNPTLERIEIRVTPLDRNTFPAGGVKVRCSFPEPLARGAIAQLQGIVQAPDYEAALFVEAPAGEGRMQTVYLDVDDYPRAFVYRVPCGPASSDLPEASDVLEVRITSPAPNLMLKAPVDVIPVEFQVDAPVGAFEHDRDVVEVGIDRDRDRDFSREPTMRLYSDRQAEITLERFGTNGIVAIRADVHDFKVAVPGGALQNIRVNIAARAQVAARTAWAPPVEIGLDGAAPQISRIELRPDRIVPIGTDLEVDVWSVDAELSGTAQVEVGFDVDGTGLFSEKAPPVKAVAAAPPKWSVKVPTANLPAGATTLLVRATDLVGNVGEISKVRLQLATPGDAAAAAAASSRIAGVVRYGGKPLEKAQVVLTSAATPESPEGKKVAAGQTDADGRFALEGVPAGSYTLSARGLARNRPRTAEQAVVIPPPPQKAPRVELDLR